MLVINVPINIPNAKAGWITKSNKYCPNDFCVISVAPCYCAHWLTTFVLIISMLTISASGQCNLDNLSKSDNSSTMKYTGLAVSYL